MKLLLFCAKGFETDHAGKQRLTILTTPTAKNSSQNLEFL